MILAGPCSECGAWPPEVDSTDQLDAWRAAHPCAPDLARMRALLELLPPDPNAGRHYRELARAVG